MKVYLKERQGFQPAALPLRKKGQGTGDKKTRMWSFICCQSLGLSGGQFPYLLRMMGLEGVADLEKKP